MEKSITTRFAPAPTGMLHIGGARTALFNWLFARARHGQFLLRIEDTDRARSTAAAERAILDGMIWLGLDFDGEPVRQFARQERHAEVAHALLAQGLAYRCFATPDEIAEFRAQARARGKSTLFNSPWRDTAAAASPDRPFAIRLKTPHAGITRITDAVHGVIEFRNDTIDDQVLLRSDGTPVYNLSVVVDDHDMGITHVIRGDDHQVNAVRQTMIYAALGWALPVWAHVPLIHGADGKKLSKRHGAIGLNEFVALGYPPVAMRNYLARLGWSHGDDEFFSDVQAREWFTFEGIGHSPARFDWKKLNSLSRLHIRTTPAPDLLAMCDQFLHHTGQPALESQRRQRLADALNFLATRAKTLVELLDLAHFCLASVPISYDDDARTALKTFGHKRLMSLAAVLKRSTWQREALEQAVREHAQTSGCSMAELAQPLRAALSGRGRAPSAFDMLVVLGCNESVARLEHAGEINEVKC